MRTINVETWEAFESKLKDLRQNWNSTDQKLLPLLFRGQADSRWALSTTLERNKRQGMLFADYYRLISSIRPEVETFTRNDWTIPPYAEVEKLTQDYDGFSMNMTFGRYPAYDYLAYLRHHSFPSPLLDWTRSAAIAAFFAFREFILGESVSIYVLSESKSHIGSSNTPRLYHLGPRIKTHRRHFLQQCDYTMCLGFNDNEWRFTEHEPVLAVGTLFEGTHWNFSLLKINIPSSERFKVLKLLDEQNINAFSLFGSEESLMETIAERELHLSARY